MTTTSYNPSVLITVRSDSRLPFVGAAGADEYTCKRGLRSRFRHVWAFDRASSSWASLPELRRTLRDPGVSFLETWQRGADDDLAGARLVKLLPVTPEGSEANAPVTTERKCTTCGRTTTTLAEAPRLTFEAGPRSAAYGLIWAPESSCQLMRVAVFRALEAAGLTTGLDTYPVTVTNLTDTFVGLRAPESLGWPVSAYGSKEPPCPECGATSPLYNFYPVFERRETDSLWFHHPLYGEGAPIVDAKVWCLVPRIYPNRVPA